jgi:hypothetical protein
MIIEIGDYILEQSTGSSDRFDLNQIKVTEAGVYKGKTVEGGNEYMKNLGYSMPLDRCLKKIVFNNLAANKDMVSLKEFMEFWKEEMNKLEKLLENIPK